MLDKLSYKNGKRYGDWSCGFGLSSIKQFYIDGFICGHYQHIINSHLIENDYYAR